MIAFEVYDRFDRCIATFKSRQEADDFVSYQDIDEGYMMEVIEVKLPDYERPEQKT